MDPLKSSKANGKAPAVNKKAHSLAPASSRKANQPPNVQHSRKLEIITAPAHGGTPIKPLKPKGPAASEKSKSTTRPRRRSSTSGISEVLATMGMKDSGESYAVDDDPWHLEEDTGSMESGFSGAGSGRNGATSLRGLDELMDLRAKVADVEKDKADIKALRRRAATLADEKAKVVEISITWKNELEAAEENCAKLEAANAEMKKRFEKLDAEEAVMRKKRDTLNDYAQQTTQRIQGLAKERQAIYGALPPIMAICFVALQAVRATGMPEGGQATKDVNEAIVGLKRGLPSSEWERLMKKAKECKSEDVAKVLSNAGLSSKSEIGSSASSKTATPAPSATGKDAPSAPSQMPPAASGARSTPAKAPPATTITIGETVEKSPGVKAEQPASHISESTAALLNSLADERFGIGRHSSAASTPSKVTKFAPLPYDCLTRPLSPATLAAMQASDSESEEEKEENEEIEEDEEMKENEEIEEDEEDEDMEEAEHDVTESPSETTSTESKGKGKAQSTACPSTSTSIERPSQAVSTKRTHSQAFTLDSLLNPANHTWLTDTFLTNAASTLLPAGRISPFPAAILIGKAIVRPTGVPEPIYCFTVTSHNSFNDTLSIFLRLEKGSVKYKFEDWHHLIDYEEPFATVVRGVGTEKTKQGVRAIVIEIMERKFEREARVPVPHREAALSRIEMMAGGDDE